MTAVDPREVARWTWLVLRSVAFKGPQAGYMPGGAEDGSGRWVNTPEQAAGKWDDCPTLPATILPDASQVDPREVARWAHMAALSYKGSPEHGYNKTEGEGSAFVGGGQVGFRPPTTPDKTADRLTTLPTMPATILPDACTVHPPRFPADRRVIAYMDPPYLNTTGYASDLPRAEVVRIARLWADAGADVYISEAEPIPELVAEGWHKLDISSTRRGQKRTFSKQQAEWLTCNRAPAWTPGATRQRTLFSLETA